MLYNLSLQHVARLKAVVLAACQATYPVPGVVQYLVPAESRPRLTYNTRKNISIHDYYVNQVS